MVYVTGKRCPLPDSCMEVANIYCRGKQHGGLLQSTRQNTAWLTPVAGIAHMYPARRNRTLIWKVTRPRLYCKYHAEDGMVNANHRHCLHDSCVTIPNFNVEGKTAAYCRQHARKGAVDVRSKLCLQDFCTTRAGFNAEGGKVAALCKQHAANDMLNILAKHCSNIHCTKVPAWGTLNDVQPSTCLRHKGDIVGRPVINSRRRYEVARCSGLSLWGFDGKQPTHCRHHGPLKGGLVCATGRARR